MYNIQPQQLIPLTEEIWDNDEDNPAHLYILLEGQSTKLFGGEPDNFILKEHSMFFGQDCP